MDVILVKPESITGNERVLGWHGLAEPIQVRGASDSECPEGLHAIGFCASARLKFRFSRDRSKTRYRKFPSINFYYTMQEINPGAPAAL